MRSADAEVSIAVSSARTFVAFARLQLSVARFVAALAFAPDASVPRHTPVRAPGADPDVRAGHHDRMSDRTAAR